MDFDNLDTGSEDEAVAAFESHLDDSEPTEPTDDPDGEREVTPAPEADDGEPEEPGEPEADDGEPAPDGDPEGGDPEEPQTFTVKVNGEEQAVTLDELTKGYMKDADYRQKTAQVAEMRKQAEAETAERFQKLDQRLSELDVLIDAQEKETNWDELRDLDPSEYMRQKELLAKRQEAREKSIKERQEHYQKQVEAYKAQELEKLTSAIPDWLDESARKQEIGEMRTALKDEYGFTDQEVNSMLDHRLVVLARDAWKGKKAQQELDKRRAEAKRKVESAPPLQKPRQNGGKVSEAEKVKALRARARKGDDDAAAELMFMGL